MKVNYLDYRLDHGYIQNWLVAGPQVIALNDLKGATGDRSGLKLKVQNQYHVSDSMVTATPVDQEAFQVGDESLPWLYMRCHEDHLVDVSAVYPGPVYLRTWAYTQIETELPDPLAVTFVLTTTGTAEVWLNGNLVFQKTAIGDGLETQCFPVQLAPKNEILIRFENVTFIDCLNSLALRLADLPSEEIAQGLSITIPTLARFPNRQVALERVLEKAYLEEVVNTRGAKFNLRWAEDLNEQMRYAYQVQDLRGSIYVEGSWDTNDKNPLDIGHGYRLFERPFQVVLKAPGKEYFEQGLLYQRGMPLHVLDNTYSEMPYASYAERRTEALEDALKHETNLFGEIAKLELGKWQELKIKLVLEAIDRVNRNENGSLTLLMGLLLIAARFMPKPEFSEKLKGPLEACIIKFDYGADRPGLSESETILFATTEIVAGQLYAQHPLGGSESGQWRREHGEKLARIWLKQRGQYGFMQWNSNAAYELNFLALSQLASLAESTEIGEMAAILMDKMLFTLAVNSYKGAFGVSHGYTQASMIKSAQLEATSGVSRLLWGMGVYNQHILGTVGLACSNYEFPSFFTELAAAAPEEMWSKEHHADAPASGANEVNLVTYKTPDYMLSSAQDYHPGQKGSTEHIAQATFGPDALVFINHPTSMHEHDGNLSGFWMGNGSLPRVAQWKDTLMAVYNLPEDDWLGFTHAFFPVYSFDEYSFKNQWAFARKGDGYIAITAACGIEHVWRGPDGYRELRSYGRQNTWLIQMGRKSQDGGFGDFRLKVLKSRLAWREPGVSFHSPKGIQFEFGWEGPLLLDGKEQSIAGFKHIENPYCSAELPARSIEIGFGDFLMRLNFD
jgi:hypothetical protein